MNRSSRLCCLSWLAAACLAAGASPLAAQPAVRVTDLNTDDPIPTESLFIGIAEHAGSVYFAAFDGVHGSELWRADGAGGAPELVADLCPGFCSSNPSDLTSTGAALYFSAEDGVHGRELWVSDAGGTRLVADLVPGTLGSLPVDLASFGDGQLLFSATDELRGREPWVSDGTAEGTRLLLEIHPGTPSSTPVPLGALGSQLLFAATDAAHGTELWATDGTAEGTGLVADICPGAQSSLADTVALRGSVVAAAAGGQLFLLATDCTHGTELWATDGTAANTRLVEDILPGAAGGSPIELTPLGSRILFSAADPTHGEELWVSDGTAAGTDPVADLRPGAESSSPRELTVLGGKVYFHAGDGVHGRELWASDGTLAGTALVAEVRNGGAGGFGLDLVHGLTAVGSRLVFFADDGSDGNEPWASDGTTAGTGPLGDLRPGPTSSFPWLSDLAPSHRAVAGGRLFFRGVDAAGETEIWSTDGTAAGTSAVDHPDALSSSFEVAALGRLGLARSLGDLGSALLFAARDGIPGLGLWASDGTVAGTLRLTAAPEVGALLGPQQITVLGDLALFATSTPSGWILQRTDGTPAGTSEVASFPSLSSFPPPLTRLGGRVVFSQGGGLWASDGTAAGTAPIALAGTNGSPVGMTALPAAGKVVFRAFDPTSGQELWVSDGTAAGTQQLADLWPGFTSSSPSSMIAAGPLVFFSADTPAVGRELWATDGTPAGTRLVADVRPGVAGSLRVPVEIVGGSLERFVAVGSTVFFAAHRLVTGEELWKSDGTAAGTVMVRDIFPGPGSAEIRWLTSAGASGSSVYFVADDGEHGRELWVSDGTEAGTRMVEDILPGAGSGRPTELAVVDGLLLFSAHAGDAHGVEPWKSNGTAAGTSRIQDIAPGPLPSTPLAFTAAGPNVYFPANDGTTGFELWAMPRTSLSRFADVPPSHWAWPFVEALAAAGLTSGCGGGNYCPAMQVSRAQMAVFLVAAVHGAGFVPPPATGTRFTDVAADAFAAAHIEQIAADGVTSGCAASPPRYCPASLVSRAQMAVFLLVAKHGAGYTPPGGVGKVFSDVGADHWAVDWIEQLAAEGITGGCGGGRFCPDGLITRAEMAVFLTAAFELLP